MRRRSFALFAALFHSTALFAANTPKVSQVPAGLAFVRSFDAEFFVERPNRFGLGAQSLRLRTRYMDPDVNAFVGFVTGVHHFNDDMRIGALERLDTAATFWNWGIDLGVQRGRHLWELDIMGSLFSSTLGPTVALVGEHAFGKHWTIYHRSEANFYLTSIDTIFDLDQGAYYSVGDWSLSLGYRIFALQHMNRSGPRAGLRYRFENPKIPFIFPSLG